MWNVVHMGYFLLLYIYIYLYTLKVPFWSLTAPGHWKVPWYGEKKQKKKHLCVCPKNNKIIIITSYGLGLTFTVYNYRIIGWTIHLNISTYFCGSMRSTFIWLHINETCSIMWSQLRPPILPLGVCVREREKIYTGVGVLYCHLSFGCLCQQCHKSFSNGAFQQKATD